MKKKQLIIILIFSLAAIFTLGLYSASRQTKITTSTKKPETDNKEKINFSGLEINDFTKEAEKVAGGETLLLVDTPDYQILFFNTDQKFLISILGSPFAEKRLTAEKALLNQLGIGENEACQLEVVTTTPMYANPTEAGTNFPLSFCP